jgi:hypothetical protein
MDWFPGMIVTYGAAAVFLAAIVENLAIPFPAFPLIELAGASPPRFSSRGPAVAAWGPWPVI